MLYQRSSFKLKIDEGVIASLMMAEEATVTSFFLLPRNTKRSNRCSQLGETTPCPVIEP
jgi:hypothetical protein